MASASRSTTRDLIEFDRDIRRFNVIQAIDKICSWLTEQHPELDKDQAYERIQFIANPSQAFAASDIERVEAYTDKYGQYRTTVTLNLLALFGASSPLPSYYSDYVSNNESKAIQNFLDIFHHRIHRLLHTIWKKYRYNASFRSGASDPFSHYTFSLLGLKDETLRTNDNIDWVRLLPYLGLLNQRVRSAAAIEATLRYYFQLPQIDIEQCTLRYCAIHPSQKNQLGTVNNTLGQTTVLGETIRDRANKFRIHIRELTWVQFHRFLEGEPDWLTLHQLVRFAVKDPMDFDIQLHLQQGEPRPLKIQTDNECRLGWTSWLGSKPNESNITLSGNTLC
ncbi:type VI secretion system baseplate subunit TssG [Photobacterium lipolyticum]|uniref:Type VI secretion system baseplate subunit TssG n=1 Tax=Photobacterium lipolyticum TaxID=266810 RepID=A0A2T3MYN6_9GAMM|nr:type VI secretion system baseplate subunit TssG [Photobacterium lipolyticum]PSW05102.1 type VI secretion system baseplate subunit TssG [Photobacterium lipolyticum]